MGLNSAVILLYVLPCLSNCRTSNLQIYFIELCYFVKMRTECINVCNWLSLKIPSPKDCIHLIKIHHSLSWNLPANQVNSVKSGTRIDISPGEERISSFHFLSFVFCNYVYVLGMQ